jgi:predicted DNA-binding transcriptional regulator AlpA
MSWTMRELPNTNGKHHEPYNNNKVIVVVKRYDPSWDRPYEMDESRIGQYVLYSDYRDLAEHFEEALSVTNLVGVTEIANMVGMSRQAVSNWRRRHKDFPQPIADLNGGPVFHYKTIEQWLIKRGFTKGAAE